jgi:hypothetical protein
MFLYDTIILLNARSLVVDELMETLLLGHHDHTKAHLQAPSLSKIMTKSESAILTYTYMLLHNEMLLIIERLRYFYLHDLNKGQELQCPPGWVLISAHHKDIMDLMVNGEPRGGKTYPCIHSQRKIQVEPFVQFGAQEEAGHKE